MKLRKMLGSFKSRILVLLGTLICLVILSSLLTQGLAGLLTDLSSFFTGEHDPDSNHPPHLHLQPWKLEHHFKGRENYGHRHLHPYGSIGMKKSYMHDTTGLLVRRIPDEKGNAAVQHQQTYIQSVIKRKSQGKVVLVWNKLYDHDFDMIGLNGLRHPCPTMPKCTLTNNTKLLASADAVVFFMRTKDHWEFPKNRTPNQRYVLLLNESPVQREYHFERYDHFFNLTMTYRQDSDIPFLYGNKYPRKSLVPITEPWWLAEMAVMKGKKKLAAWSVSHCITDSKREDYVEELKKYINIDIYGRCGTLKCLPPRSQKCYDLIRKSYRFVLAFESSACKDYITEKVYDNLLAGVVPVVYGGANYQEMLPPHSYINVGDFPSPKHLGQYLQHLMHNDAEYLKYFQWKRSFYVKPQNYEWQLSFCKLCKVLHRPIHQHKSYSTKDLKTNWGPWNCNADYLGAMRKLWVP